MEMFHSYTVLISNVPGPSSLEVMDGCVVQDIFTWTATRGNTGLLTVNNLFASSIHGHMTLFLLQGQVMLSFHMMTG